MAITVSDILNMHAFVPNPTVISPFPVGIWKAQRTVATDGSGGIVRWTVTPPTDIARAYKFLWSLESFSFLTSASAAVLNVFVDVLTGENVSRAGGVENLRFAAAYITANFAGRQDAPYSAYPPSALNFIHQPGGGNLNQYAMEINNVNAQVYTMTFWGYFWNSEARRLASGPRRP